MNRLIIFGLRDFADIALEYFSFDSDYEVVAFTASKDHVESDEKFGLPVIPFEEIGDHFDPKRHSFFAAITYQGMNTVRRRFLSEAKLLGFTPASYISSKSFVWRNVNIGEHCFIFEDNTVQPFSVIDDNTVLWSGNHIGHHSYVGKDVFISSQVVVSGHVSIGDNCFLGVNSTIAHGVSVGNGCWINSHTLITSDVQDQQFVFQTQSGRSVLDVKRLEEKLNKKDQN